MCSFFGEIPNIHIPEKKFDQLKEDIIPLLWNFTFLNNDEIAEEAFRALSKFEIENFELKLIPEIYKKDIKLSKLNSENTDIKYTKNTSSNLIDSEMDTTELNYVPG